MRIQRTRSIMLVNMKYIGQKSSMHKCLINLVLFVWLSSGAIYGQKKAGVRNVSKQLDSLFAPFDQFGSPGYAVGIFKNQKIWFAKGYGMANLEYQIPITANTVFNTASLSKQFTAACIAILISENALSLEDAVSKYVPEVGKYKDTIRIKHLIYFTSGLHEYHILPRYNKLNWGIYDYYTIDTAIAASLAQPELQFKPGEKWNYTNTDYMLLAKIVEKVSGQTMQEFAQKHLFGPLKMKSSQINDDVTSIIRNRATGYILRDDATIADAQKAGFYLRKGDKYIQVHRNAPHYGGSGVFTSINDWYLWDKNFYTHQVKGRKFYEQMHQRMRFGHSKTNDAFGLVFGDYKGEEMIWYAGGDTGFNSYVMRFPKQQVTVVCFSNLGVGGNAEKMAHMVADLLIKHNVIETSKTMVSLQ